MTTMSEALSFDQARWTGRQARWFLLGMHVPYVAFTAAAATTGLGFAPDTNGAIALPLVLGVGALQLRHSFATSSGVRPRYWPWTFLLLLVVAFAPAPFFGLRWVTLQWYATASALMLLPRRLAIVAVVVDVIGWSAWNVSEGFRWSPEEVSGVAQAAYLFVYPTAILLMGGGGLYGAARLVKAIDELRDARTELAELAVGRERLRISRDIHDLLGHTLSAVSLKGDLALRLLERDHIARAAAEIESLTTVARSALRDIRDVAQQEHRVSFATEAEGATSLLEAAGIRTRIVVTVGDLAPPVDDLFGWALREGVTNVLRHSSAKACSIHVRRESGKVHLDIENDGADPPSPGGQGLTGLTARAAALGGSAVGQPTPEGCFHLHVEVPQVVA